MRRGTSPEEMNVTTPRSGRLAIAFQEPLTAVVRLKNARTPEFRGWVIKEVNKSQEHALQNGYSAEDVDEARFAVVAFLDEAALYSESPALAGWRSVQAELYHSEDAGETFFEHLRNIQRRGNTGETADLLEIYAQCLLLGFEGKYRLGRWGDESTKFGSIPPILAQIKKQISKIRQNHEMKQPWRIESSAAIERDRDPWTRRLLILLLSMVALSVLTFFVSRGSLQRGLNQVQVAVQARQG